MLSTSHTDSSDNDLTYPLQPSSSHESEPAPVAMDIDPVEPSVHASSSPPPPPPLPPPTLSKSGRPVRDHRLPQRFRDILPERIPAITESYEPSEDVPPEPVLPRVVLIVRDRLATAINSFNLWRWYPRRPSSDPDDVVAHDDLSKGGPSIARPSDPALSKFDPPWPFANMGIHRMMTWLNTGGSEKTEREATRLVDTVINVEGFQASDFQGFDAHRENVRYDDSAKELAKKKGFFEDFKETSVEIEVPSGRRDIASKIFHVPGLLYRDLLSVIRSAFAEPLAAKFHYYPFKIYWRSPTSGSDERVHSEIYNSDAWIQADEDIQRHASPDPEDPHCKHEKVVAGIMIWSDSTHLANFGTAKLWPIYMYFANLTKYIRAIPGSGACQHIAYIPSV